MIPVLYKSIETNFNHNGLGCLVNVVKCISTEKRNGLYELELTYPVGSFLYSEIKKQRIIKAKANERYQDQLFAIYYISKPIKGLITVKAEHISYKMKKNFVKKVNYSGNCEGALSALSLATTYENRFNLTSDILMSGKYNVEKVNLFSAICGVKGSIIDTYGNGADLVRDNFNISVKANGGVDKNVLISYKKNLVGFTCDEDDSDIVTGIYPYAKINDVEITLSEEYIYSNRVNDYPEKIIIPVDFSNHDEVIDESTLRSVASKYFSVGDKDVPKVNYNIEFIALSKTEEYKGKRLTEDISIYDTVIVRHEVYGLNSKIKVIEVSYDTLNESYINIKLGQPKSSINSVLNESIDSVTEASNKDKITTGYLDKVMKELTDEITGNDGGYVRLNPPSNPSEILILDNEDINQARTVWRWNKEGWGISLNGYNGPYQGLTKNGKLVISEATVEQINAILIKSGILSSYDGKTWINLDDGEFNFRDRIKFVDNIFTISLSTGQNLEDKIGQVEKDTTYNVEIVSTNGAIFKNGQISTKLIAVVRKGSKDITSTIDMTKFKWTRISEDKVGDTAWNTSHFGGTKEVTITKDDVKNRATFNCEILE